jgi:DNA-binding IclR family transcriptional regulator
MPETVSIKAAKRTIDIIEIITHSDGLSLSELAAELEIPKSTTYDYLQTLMELEYLVHDDDGYRTATRFLELGARRRLQFEVFKKAKPQLKRLADETGEHATLVIEEHGMGVLLHTLMGSSAVEVVAHDGTRTYLHTTAPGKAIIANMSEDRIDSVLDEYEVDGLPAYASETITDRGELYAELEEVQERGYATDQNEALDGMVGVGVPLVRRDIKQVIGALSIYAPVNRLSTDELKEDIPELLLQSANVIELNLSYSQQR